MFKSGNVLSSNGRGIVREVRVAVFAVISRHIRRRYSLLSLSLSLVLLLLLLLRAALLLFYLCGLCLDGIFVVKKEIKRLLGSFFLFLVGLIFAIFSPFLAIDPLCKNSSPSSSEFFSRGSIFPHLHSTTHLIGWTRERGEDFREHATGKKNEGLCVLRCAFEEREREREREKLYCRILLLVEIENGKKRGTSLVDQREKNETRESDTVHGGNDGADDGAEEKQLRHEQVHAGVRFVG